jgi:hypothetical protein
VIIQSCIVCTRGRGQPSESGSRDLGKKGVRAADRGISEFIALVIVSAKGMGQSGDVFLDLDGSARIRGGNKDRLRIEPHGTWLDANAARCMQVARGASKRPWQD